jgi:hypothetical protein
VKAKHSHLIIGNPNQNPDLGAGKIGDQRKSPLEKVRE